MTVEMRRAAVFSVCSAYRYTLERRWSDGPVLLWVLLNPSNADATYDDPTNRRGIGFSQRWGYGGCVFVNLFATRTPAPEEMKLRLGPVGPDNDYHILDQAERCQDIIVAWGTHGNHRQRDVEVIELLRGYDLKCLGTTKHGHPKHPLYLRKDTARERFAK